MVHSKTLVKIKNKNNERKHNVSVDYNFAIFRHFHLGALHIIC